MIDTDEGRSLYNRILPVAAAPFMPRGFGVGPSTAHGHFPAGQSIADALCRRLHGQPGNIAGEIRKAAGAGARSDVQRPTLAGGLL
jgi:hypothetical protein